MLMHADCRHVTLPLEGGIHQHNSWHASTQRQRSVPMHVVRLVVPFRESPSPLICPLASKSNAQQIRQLGWSLCLVRMFITNIATNSKHFFGIPKAIVT